VETAYLFACGLGAVLWITCFVARPDLRPLQLGMSLIGLPLAFSDLFYVPKYWRPETMGHIPVGIEGFLFSFEAAGVCAVIYLVVSRRRTEFIDGHTLAREQPIAAWFPLDRLFTFRTLVAFIPLPVSAIVSLVFQTNLEWGLYAGLLVAILVTVLLRRDLAIPAVVAALAFTPIYTAALLIWIAAYPDVHDWFTLWRMPHWFLLGVPLTEIVFGGLFAAFWTGLYPMVFVVRYVKMEIPADTIDQQLRRRRRSRLPRGRANRGRCERGSPRRDPDASNRS
jgi:hypothetical protein